jgi:hypothetical protein
MRLPIVSVVAALLLATAVSPQSVLIAAETGASSAAAPAASTRPAPDAAAASPAPRALTPQPAAADLSRANALVNTNYAADIKAAKAPDTKALLAQKLIAAAKDETSASRFALLSRAKGIAIDAGDIPDADAAMLEIESTFSIDSTQLRLEAYTQLARGVSSNDDAGVLCGDLAAMLPLAIREERFAIAKSAADLALRIARKTSNTDLQKQAALEERWVRLASDTHASLEKSFATLASKPQDPGANLNVGEYRCFLRTDWGGGLPMLALGGDSVLRTLAAAELANPLAPDAQAKLADGWWDVAAKLSDVQKDLVLTHAAHWYKAALPGLGGLEKSTAQKRLEQVNALDLFPRQPTTRPVSDTMTVEFQSEGGCILQIFAAGMHWNAFLPEKPGRCGGANYPTYVDGKPWLPVWTNIGLNQDTTDVFPVPIGAGPLDYEVIGIAPRRGEPGITKRPPVTFSSSAEGSVLHLDDARGVPMWYSIRFTKSITTELPTQLAGRWLEVGSGSIVTLKADGSAAGSVGGVKGTWRANPEGTIVKVQWDAAGSVDFYKLNGKRWTRSSFLNGIQTATGGMTAP